MNAQKIGFKEPLKIFKRCYSPAVSEQNSWITYGANRVTKLVITQTRSYRLSGTVTVDTTPRVVYEHQDVGIPEFAPEPPDED